MNHYLLALMWLLGIPGHYREWDHYKAARLLAVFWPLTIIGALVLLVIGWIWGLRPRPGWRWRRPWVRKISLRHWGWTTKDGKLCGLVHVKKFYGNAVEDQWVFSGIAFGRWAIGTLTWAEIKRTDQ